MSSVDELARLVEGCQDSLLLVVTGAGISAASGIPTFRGPEPEAIWRHTPQELATRACFERDPVTHWRWYFDRFRMLDDVKPNAGHRGLVDLERWQAGRGEFLLVTQNIDSLHERAGSRSLIKVHGTADRLRCSAAGCVHAAPRGSLPRAEIDLEPFVGRPGAETLPRCPACGAVLRPHVLFFDEYYDEHDDYRFATVRAAAASAGALLFVGTSLAVGVTELLLWEALRRRVGMALVDPAGTSRPELPMCVVAEPAEEVLPRLVARLGEP